MRSIRRILIILALVFGFSTQAVATGDTKIGKITNIDVTESGNYSFRIYLGGIALCGNANNWAYADKSSYQNYDTVVALLITAWSQGKDVRIMSDQDSNGNCQIMYISTL